MISEADLIDAKRVTGEFVRPSGVSTPLPNGGSFFVISSKHAISAGHVFVNPSTGGFNPEEALLTHGENGSAIAVFRSGEGATSDYIRNYSGIPPTNDEERARITQ